MEGRGQGPGELGLGRFQRMIEAIYLERDAGRGVEGTALWFVEEVGELLRAIRRGETEALAGEFADVLAWLVTLGSLTGVEVGRAALEKYGNGCPKCGSTPCACP